MVVVESHGQDVAVGSMCGGRGGRGRNEAVVVVDVVVVVVVVVVWIRFVV